MADDFFLFVTANREKAQFAPFNNPTKITLIKYKHPLCYTYAHIINDFFLFVCFQVYITANNCKKCTL